MSTLLEDVEAYLETADLYHLDMQRMSEYTNAGVEESNIYLDRLRWGVLYGTVLHRYKIDGPTEYVMVAEYEYDEGADGGDPDVTAWAVVPREVRAIEWDTL